MEKTTKSRRLASRWIRRAFILWTAFVTLWLVNSMRTQGVDPAALLNDSKAVVTDTSPTLALTPTSTPASPTALVFICGSGVAAEAYVPLLRPIAEAGHPVFIVRLPGRFAFMESQRQEALEHAHSVMTAHSELKRWVLAGHSLGGALACRAVQADPKEFSALVLLGTTHPKEDNLSGLTIPVTKVYGSNDGVAKPDRMFANRGLLPATTRWVEIAGGNHSQFGHYGHQLLDGRATISREEQQAAARSALLEALKRISN